MPLPTNETTTDSPSRKKEGLSIFIAVKDSNIHEHEIQKKKVESVKPSFITKRVYYYTFMVNSII